MWIQTYDPLGSQLASTLVSAIPIVVLLGGMAVLRMRAHWAALAALASAAVVSALIYGMPVEMVAAASAYGAVYGLLPIGWIILNIIFLYRLAREKGQFDVLQDSIQSVSADKRIQLLFIAFSFGAFFEGAAGFGTPVAVTAAILIGLGFSPLSASGLSLIANTAPVAFGALGTPIIALAATTGLDLLELSSMIGRQLPFFSILVPIWLIWAYAGFKGMIGVLPAVLVAGVVFAATQFAISNFHGPWLVDVGAAVASMAALAGLLKVWRPKMVEPRASTIWGREDTKRLPFVSRTYSRRELMQAWLPWVILSALVLVWGLPSVKAALYGVFDGVVAVPGLHNLVARVPPVVVHQTLEAATYNFNLLPATGTGILVAALVSGRLLGFGWGELLRRYGATIVAIRLSLFTICAMLALGFLTKYSGTDTVLGLAFANAGWLYPLLGTMLGWLGVALTGSDTASNILFGRLQVTSANSLGLSPVLMASANSSGGVMGKMIDAQSIVVASTATGWTGREGDILRFVFWHSVVLALLVGALVMLQAYVPFFQSMVP